MLPKNRRLNRPQFSNVLSLGKRFTSPHFLLYVFKDKVSTPSKFAFSVSKKIAKKAVDRNRYRRQGYSVISKQEKNIPTGFLCIFIFKKGIYPISFFEMEKEIVVLLSNLPKNTLTIV
jgi:ribonuclease P protein component